MPAVPLLDQNPGDATDVWCVWRADDVPEWERELQAELQEYEVVDDGNNITDADLEQEIMKQIEAESQNT